MSADRGQFSSKLGFILAAAGSAVGLGNLAAFPVGAAKNGGAAFLILYLVFVVFICFPIMISELSIGRKTKSNPIGAFDQLSGGDALWKSAGKLAVITPFMIGVFYLVLTVWVMGYFLETVLGRLDFLATSGSFSEFITSPLLFVFVFIVVIIMYFILNGGVKNGIEKAAKILMPMLAIMLVLLTIFVLTLDNASAGISFYLVPDFTKLNGAVISGALSQAFFSLSLGMGILITYGSYLSKESDIIDSAKLVAISDSAIAFFAGLLILPAIFSFNPNITGSELSESSVSLIFVFLPQVFMSMQGAIGYVGASIVAATFFLAVFFAAITSIVSLIEVPVAHYVDDKGMDRKKSLIMVMAATVALSLLALASFGMVPALANLPGYGGAEAKSFFDYIIDMFYETILPLIGFIVCVFTAYRWKTHNLAEEISSGNSSFAGSFLQKYVNFSMGTLIPVFVFFVFISTVLRIYFGIDLVTILF
jgi:NSS family neurotransmitter:Na+ symporter